MRDTVVLTTYYLLNGKSEKPRVHFGVPISPHARAWRDRESGGDRAGDILKSPQRGLVIFAICKYSVVMRGDLTHAETLVRSTPARLLVMARPPTQPTLPISRQLLHWLKTSLTQP